MSNYVNFKRSPGPDGQLEEISLVSLVNLNNDFVVTAVRDKSGKLKLISWKVDSNGGITRSAGPDVQGEEISLVSILPFYHSRTVTVVQDKGGILKLKLWEADKDKGDIHSSPGKEFQDKEENLAYVIDDFSNDGLTIAVLDRSGKMKLIYYYVAGMGFPRS